MTPPAPDSDRSTFQARNWWRNGRACKVLTVCSLLCGMALLMPWKPSFAGVARRGDFDVWTRVTPTANGFHDGSGWVIAPIIAAILWVCGRRKEEARGVRWLPLAGAIAIFACAASVAFELQRASEAWVASFRHSKPIVDQPAGVIFACLLSFVMTIAGWFFGRSRGTGAA